MEQSSAIVAEPVRKVLREGRSQNFAIDKTDDPYYGERDISKRVTYVLNLYLPNETVYDVLTPFQVAIKKLVADLVGKEVHITAGTGEGDISTKEAFPERLA